MALSVERVAMDWRELSEPLKAHMVPWLSSATRMALTHSSKWGFALARDSLPRWRYACPPAWSAYEAVRADELVLALYFYALVEDETMRSCVRTKTAAALGRIAPGVPAHPYLFQDFFPDSSDDEQTRLASVFLRQHRRRNKSGIDFAALYQDFQVRACYAETPRVDYHRIVGGRSRDQESRWIPLTARDAVRLDHGRAVAELLPLMGMPTSAFHYGDEAAAAILYLIHTAPTAVLRAPFEAWLHRFAASDRGRYDLKRLVRVVSGVKAHTDGCYNYIQIVRAAAEHYYAAAVTNL